ncbi:hypothetical protein G5B46_10545 [Caulobacter sp. 602-2]|uniref:Uncharacterized protein n=1 Tax=Caulobacter sp. 602-2 TaxID=2710887 RepID=A0A6G4QWM4_9CAUL|nr:hypothetical protein [Caulobacter sp. 602-2]NGM50046.1 hypothetical protein [Caulobacter sp. 602-2]
MRRLLAVSLSALLSFPAAALAQAPASEVVTTNPSAPAQSAPEAAIPLVAAPPAGGQPAPAAEAAQVAAPPAPADPLADLIAASGPQTTDEEDEAPAAAPAPRHKPTILPIPAPETSTPAAPGAPMSVEQAYELRVKGSIAAAQGLQGPLDGGWVLRGAGGVALYSLQIADPAGGYGPVEGAWRDLRRPGAVGSTGLIDSIERTYDGGAAVRFMARPGVGSTLALSVGPDGAWSGRLTEDGAAPATVDIERTGAPILPAGYAVAARGPVIWPPRAAPTATRTTSAAPARAAPCSTRGKKGKALKAAKAKCAAAAKKSGAKGKAAARSGKAGKGKAVKPGSRKKTAAAGARKKRR